MLSEALRKTAARCRHYAMCKIDFLGTGVCPAGREHHFVSYYPQGRMDIYDALTRRLIPLSKGLLHIAQTCTLCEVCDRQCHFYTELRPLAVMRGLKEHVEEAQLQGEPFVSPPADPLIEDLRAIVGEAWATNDPATLITYADDPFPLAGSCMPRAVVLPASQDEVSEILALAKWAEVPYAVRGNGASVFGFVFTKGIVLDLNRMGSLSFDEDNWSARVGPGVTAFELQRAAQERGLRVNVAEPAASVCGNLICTGIFSTWSAAYGTCADNLVDAQFVDGTKAFHLNDKHAPNAFAFQHETCPSPGVCTEATVKLHPTSSDEQGMLVPFSGFEEAVAFARELSVRRIGLAIAVLGRHYLANFISPTKALARKLKENLVRLLGSEHMVYLVTDSYGAAAVRAMRPAVIDNDLFRTIMLGLPRLLTDEWLDLLGSFEAAGPPFVTLCKPELRKAIESILAPSPATLASAVEPDLREFYEELYYRPEMSDLVWLNLFRIVSSRMSRDGHMLAFLVYVPPDRMDVIQAILSEFRRVGDLHDIVHDFGFLTPMDLGKRAVLEYDYYLDHTDEADKEKIRMAMSELEPILEAFDRNTKGVRWLKYVFSQGCSRKEGFLYAG